MNEAAATLRVGIIGTGEMGRPLVDRLLAAGHVVAVHARRPEVRAELAALGVEIVDTAAAVATGRDVVILYVYSDQQVRDLALDDGLLEAMAPGSTLVIHTTGSPATATAIAERGRESGVAVLDAPGSGGPAQVAAGTLALFVGGEPDAVERCRPLFAAYASAVTHFGPVGSGQKVKLVNNLLFGAHVQLSIEAARLSTAFGIDQGELARALHGCSGASAALDMVGAMGSAEELLQSAGRFIHKDVVVARDLAEQLDAPLGTLDAVTTAILDLTRPG